MNVHHLFCIIGHVTYIGGDGDGEPVEGGGVPPVVQGGALALAQGGGVSGEGAPAGAGQVQARVRMTPTAAT